MFERFDVVRGIVTCNTKNGCHIRIGDSSSGFLPRLFLRTGTEVFATVKFIKDDGFPILTLDSVVYKEENVA